MIFDDVASMPSLAQRVETNVRQAAYGRIRNLVVEEVQGQVIVSGRWRPRGTSSSCGFRAALELLSGDRFAERITIG